MNLEIHLTIDSYWTCWASLPFLREEVIFSRCLNLMASSPFIDEGRIFAYICTYVIFLTSVSAYVFGLYDWSLTSWLTSFILPALLAFLFQLCRTARPLCGTGTTCIDEFFLLVLRRGNILEQLLRSWVN